MLFCLHYSSVLVYLALKTIFFCKLFCYLSLSERIFYFIFCILKKDLFYFVFCILQKKLLTLSTTLQLQISINFVTLCVILFE